jgi:hypothetical protein
MPTPREVLQEAVHLATLMIDQLQYVDLVDNPGTKFRVEASAAMREPKNRDKLKRIVEGLAERLQQQPSMAGSIDTDSVPTAAELVAKAVKGLIVSINSSNNWLLGERLAIKFESIEVPWEQDERMGMMKRIVEAN